MDGPLNHTFTFGNDARLRAPKYFVIHSRRRSWLPAGILATAATALALLLGPTDYLPSLIGSAEEARGRLVLSSHIENGRIIVPITLNGVSTDAIIDTGASVLGIGRKQARQFGIDPAKQPFLTTVSTANGDVRGAEIKLDVTVGDFAVKDVPAVILDSDLNLPLIGMSFLQKLKSMELHDELVRLFD